MERIPDYIKDLLFSNDCVIVPGLGAFLINYEPSKIELANGLFSPPSKEVSFNQSINSNDGLLANEVSQREQFSYERAVQEIEKFSKNCNQRLQKNEILMFPEIGKLYLDVEKNLQFSREETNFNTETYGLPNIQFYPIHRSDFAKEQALSGRNKSRTKKPFFISGRGFAAVATILLLVIAIPLAVNYFQKNSDSSIANNSSNQQDLSTAQFGYSDDPIEEVKTDLHSLADDVETKEDSILAAVADANLAQAESAPSTNEEEPDSKEFSETIPEEIVASEEEVIQELSPKKIYLVVVGSFGVPENADNLSAKLMREGYETQVKAGKRLQSVSIKLYCAPEQLNEKLKTIRANYNKDAYLAQ